MEIILYCIICILIKFLKSIQKLVHMYKYTYAHLMIIRYNIWYILQSKICFKYMHHFHTGSYPCLWDPLDRPEWYEQPEQVDSVSMVMCSCPSDWLRALCLLFGLLGGRSSGSLWAFLSGSRWNSVRRLAQCVSCRVSILESSLEAPSH